MPQTPLKNLASKASPQNPPKPLRRTNLLFELEDDSPTANQSHDISGDTFVCWEIDEGEEGEVPDLIGVEHRSVGMVGANQTDGPGRGFLSQMLKEGSIPKFNGEPSDFSTFRWTFERFLNNAEEVHGKLTEAQKISALERALPERDRNRLILLMQKGQQVKCHGFLASMGAQLESARESQLLLRWNNLSIQHDGRILVTNVLDFELEFDQLRYHLSHLSEEECHRHLLEKLPGHMSDWIIEEEMRLRINRPQVLVEVPMDAEVDQVQETMTVLFGLHAVRVSKMKPRTFLFSLVDMDEMPKALMANGAKIRGAIQNLKVQEVRRQMNISQIFSFLKYNVDGRARKANKTPPLNQMVRGRSPTRDPHYVRQTDTGDKGEKGKTKDKGQQGGRRSFSPGPYEARGNSPQDKRPRTPPGRGQEARPAVPAAAESQSKPNPPPVRTWQESGEGGSAPPQKLSPTADFTVQDGRVFYKGWWYTIPEMHRFLSGALTNSNQGKGKGKGKGKGGKRSGSRGGGGHNGQNRGTASTPSNSSASYAQVAGRANPSQGGGMLPTTS